MRARVAGIQETLGSVAVLFDSRYSPSRCFDECENSSLGPGGWFKANRKRGRRVAQLNEFSLRRGSRRRGRCIPVALSTSPEPVLSEPDWGTCIGAHFTCSCEHPIMSARCAHQPATARKTACGCPRKTPPRVAGQSTHRGPTLRVSGLLTSQDLESAGAKFKPELVDLHHRRGDFQPRKRTDDGIARTSRGTHSLGKS